MSRLIVVVLLIVAVAPNGLNAQEEKRELSSLEQLYSKLTKKFDTIKSNQVMEFIARAVPQGIEPPNPRIAEYETFKSDKSVNFLNDGMGHVVFRQFRRLRLSDVLGKRLRGGI